MSAAKKAPAKKAAARPAAAASKIPPTGTAIEPASDAELPDAGSPGPRPVWEGNGESRQQYHARVQEWAELRRQRRNAS